MAFIVGQDISEFQPSIDWNVYKNNTNFVIIRSSFGVGYVDNKFVQYKTAARNAGIPRGFYHYAYPQYNTPEAEADWCVLQMADIQEGEVLALDYEEGWNGNVVDFCKRFLDRVSSKLSGYKPLIYLNQSLIQAHDWSSVVNSGYGLWVAAYTYDPQKNTFALGAWKFAAMQQWTSSQIVPGIQGKVDGDVFFGDIATFKKYGYVKPVVAPPATDWKSEYDKLLVQFNSYKESYKYKESDIAAAISKGYLNGKLEAKKEIINLINAY